MSFISHVISFSLKTDNDILDLYRKECFANMFLTFMNQIKNTQKQLWLRVALLQTFLQAGTVIYLLIINFYLHSLVF